MGTGRWIAVAVVTTLLATACADGGSDRVSTRAATDPTTVPTTTATTTPIATAPAAPIRVMVVGDSLALLLGFALDRRGAADGFDVEGVGVLGCGILPGESIRYGVRTSVDGQCGFIPGMWREKLDTFDPDLVVVLDGFWDAYDWIIDGVPVAFGTPEWDAFASARFAETMDLLSSDGRRVLWLLSPYFRPDVVSPAIAQYRRDHGEYRSALDDDRVRHLNDLIRATATANGCAVQIVDTRLCICPDDAYAETIDGFEVRDDGIHLTTAGADRLADYVLPRAGLARTGEC